MNENLVFIVGLVFHNLDLVHGGWQSLYHAKSIPKLINKFLFALILLDHPTSDIKHIYSMTLDLIFACVFLLLRLFLFIPPANQKGIGVIDPKLRSMLLKMSKFWFPDALLRMTLFLCSDLGQAMHENWYSFAYTFPNLFILLSVIS